MNPEQALQRLAHAGVVERGPSGWRTTPLWQRALMRAEARVLEFQEAIDEPRLPVGYALVDILGADVPDDDLRALVDALVPLELAEEREMVPDLVE